MTGWDTRATSGLRPPRAISVNIDPTHGVAGHYGGAGPFKRSDHDACRAIWRGWQDFHMSPANANNYNDIAYNLGTCHHDIILEGRSTRTRPIVRGGANGNATVNGNRYSVVAIWGANDGEWPDGLRRAWRTARDWLRGQDSRTGSGLTPHSAMSSTSCPGDPGRAFLAAGAPYPPSTGDDVTVDELRDELARFFAAAKPLEYSDSAVSRDRAMEMGAQWSGANTNTLKYTVDKKLDVLLAGQSGGDATAILARLDEMAAADVARDAAILAAVQQIEAGNTDAALAALRDLLDAAVT